jgi:hypothetical protein
LKAIHLSALLLLASAAPCLAADWVSFPMSEGPDARVDRSSIGRDVEGSIAPWAKGWMTAKTEKGAGSDGSPGYFVTDCRDQYYSFSVNPETKAIREQGAQPMRVTAGSMAQNIEKLVCGPEK